MTNNEEEDEEEVVKKIKIPKYTVYFTDMDQKFLQKILESMNYINLIRYFSITN